MLTEEKKKKEEVSVCRGDMRVRSSFLCEKEPFLPRAADMMFCLQYGGSERQEEEDSKASQGFGSVHCR